MWGDSKRDILKRKCIPTSCGIPEKSEALTSLLTQLPHSPLRENNGDLPPGVSQHCMLYWEEFAGCHLSPERITIWDCDWRPHYSKHESFTVVNFLLFSFILWMIWFTFTWKVQTSWFTCCSLKLQMESQLKINNNKKTQESRIRAGMISDPSNCIERM